METIEKSFLEEYLNLLSPDSFCILLRFYFFYLNSKDKGSDISIPSSVFQKHILVSDDKERTEFAWGELSYWNLVKRTYGQNAYELNICKIAGKSDCWFKVTLKDQGFRLRKHRNVADYLQKYIDRIISSFSNPRLAEKVNEVINGHIKFLLAENGRAELQDIKFLTDPFFEVSHLVLEKTCDVYIANYYAKKPAQYIHGILKKIKSERAEKEDTSQKTLTLKQYRQELDESNKGLAIKIASGQVQDNKSYLAYLKLKDFKNLNKLYQVGIKCLTEENRNSEIVRNYDWIEK
jgi:hypothetical protein